MFEQKEHSKYLASVLILKSTNNNIDSYYLKAQIFKVILYSYLILKKMNERITDS